MSDRRQVQEGDLLRDIATGELARAREAGEEGCSILVTLLEFDHIGPSLGRQWHEGRWVFVNMPKCKEHCGHYHEREASSGRNPYGICCNCGRIIAVQMHRWREFRPIEGHGPYHTATQRNAAPWWPKGWRGHKQGSPK